MRVVCGRRRRFNFRQRLFESRRGKDLREGSGALGCDPIVRAIDNGARRAALGCELLEIIRATRALIPAARSVEAAIRGSASSVRFGELRNRDQC